MKKAMGAMPMASVFDRCVGGVQRADGRRQAIPEDAAAAAAALLARAAVAEGITMLVPWVMNRSCEGI